jgi:carboxyl-terminal processing protease
MAARLRAAGMDAAIAGNFREALTSLRRAARLGPRDEAAADAVRLIESYLTLREQFDTGRAAEYAAAVQRVRLGLMAQDYLSVLASAKIEQKLREWIDGDPARTEFDDDEVQGMVSSFGRAATSQALRDANAEEARKLKAETVKALEGSIAALAEARILLKGNTSPYARSFRSLADACDARLKGYLGAWASASTDSAEGRRQSAERLEALERDLSEAMDDVSAMIAEKPWRFALMQGRLAKELAPDGTDVAAQEWFKELVAACRRLGEGAVSAARWQDALTAYMGLKELDPDNEEYQQRSKTILRHVRVLRLYGTQSQKEDEPRWRELVQGIDARMVEEAISALARAYVTSVDYRKVTLGALAGIRILAETPQAGASFPCLKDEGKRRKFIQEVDWAIRNFDKKDRLSDQDLILALNIVLSASDRTVQIPTAVLAREFADGFLDELDKFSSMVWPYDYDEFRKETMGRFCGVGIQITKEPGEPLRVVTPLADSPAFRRGVKTGDLILKVDGKDTVDYPISRLVRMITGEKGTKVVLTIERSSLPKPIDIPIIREEIEIRTVKGWRIDSGGGWDYRIDPESSIGYIQVTQFTSTTHEDLVDAIREARRAGVESLILDLRFNPGGLLRAAGKVANEFLRGGTVVSMRGRQQARDVQKADASGSYLADDMVILVNEASASAAEIVTGALKDWRRGTVIGQRSYGKGSVQNVIPIRYRKALLKLTTAYYYLPSGRLLHRSNGAESWGVDPDIEVAVTPKQMKRWLDLSRENGLIRDVDPGALDDKLAEQLRADIQLNTAVLLLKLKRLQSGKALTISKAGASREP